MRLSDQDKVKREIFGRRKDYPEILRGSEILFLNAVLWRPNQAFLRRIECSMSSIKALQKFSQLFQNVRRQIDKPNRITVFVSGIFQSICPDNLSKALHPI